MPLEKNKEGKITKYTGVMILALVTPVYLLFIYLGKDDIGRTASFCLGMILFAVAIRWELRKHAWFWAVMVVVLAIHVPLIVSYRWPQRWIPGSVQLPFALTDLAIILGLVRLAERLAGVKGASEINRPLTLFPPE
jgi:hypothetical protein